MIGRYLPSSVDEIDTSNISSARGKESFETVFVTVGTTQFDSLIQVTCSAEFMEFLNCEFGTNKIVFQIGQGVMVPDSHGLFTTSTGSEVIIEWFRLRPDTSDVVKSADLVITHCGAGSIMDAMRFQKPTLAVVNTNLMDNHQTELAEAMVEDGPYLFSVGSPDSLLQKMRQCDFSQLKVWTNPNFELFADEFLSFVAHS